MNKSIRKILWNREFEKCKNSPAYFYNNYIEINGKPPIKKVTDEQMRSMIIVNARRRGRDNNAPYIRYWREFWDEKLNQ